MKNLKSILSIVGVLGFTAATTSNVTACISNITSNFQEIINWKENNGEIQSLVNNKNTIYAGTKTGDDKGNLFKITKDDTTTPLTNWKESNGKVQSLLNVNDTIYVGTKTGDGKGNLFKITDDDTITHYLNEMKTTVKYVVY